MRARDLASLDENSLLIAGASVRAAAESARQAGVTRLVAADLFGDLDLLDVVDDYQRLEPGYEGLEQLHRRSGCKYAMYTGGLENYPQKISRLPGELLGVDARSLHLVRDPWHLHRVLLEAGCHSPPLLDASVPSNRADTWLVKPVRSAGGLGIVGPTALPVAAPASPEVYVQQYLQGDTYGGVFVANGRAARFLGATRALAGSRTPHRFQYAGCVGPIVLTQPQLDAWRRIGHVLATSFGLRGLFGVDVVIHEGRLCVLEVNPRWTASVEVLEHAFGWNAFADHRAACTAGALPSEAFALQTPSRFVGKQIIYANRSFTVSSADVDTWRQLQRLDLKSDQPLRWLADLPAAGSNVLVHHPLMSAFCAVSASETETASMGAACGATLNELSQQILGQA